jgi:hypothetical protein
MATDPTTILDRRICGALDRMPRLRVIARDVYDELDWLERDLASRALGVSDWSRRGFTDRMAA